MRILISGAGVAGCAAALFLARDGHDLTVIDKAPEFRKLGYCLSLKSFGMSVMHELGLLEALRHCSIPMETVCLLDRAGAVVKRYPTSSAARAAGGAVAVHRADLHKVLYDAARERTAVRFGTEIAALAQDDGGAEAHFSDGTAESFDLVIVSEGLRSTTRARLWNDEGFVSVDVVFAAASVSPDAETEPGVTQWYMAAGRSLAIIPVDASEVILQAYFRGTLPPGATNGQTRSLLTATYGDFPPRITALLDSLTARHYIFCDGVAMVTLPHLSQRRVVLLGDAGYCPTFLSGMGASLGLIGAKALAKALQESTDDPDFALARFDDSMQPLIRHFQASARRNVDSTLSRSRLRTWARRWSMRLTPRRVIAWSFGRQFVAENSIARRILE